MVQTLPRLLDCPSLENVNVKTISCGARHTALVTGMPEQSDLHISILLSAHAKQSFHNLIHI